MYIFLYSFGVIAALIAFFFQQIALFWVCIFQTTINWLQNKLTIVSRVDKSRAIWLTVSALVTGKTETTKSLVFQRLLL